MSENTTLQNYISWISFDIWPSSNYSEAVFVFPLSERN